MIIYFKHYKNNNPMKRTIIKICIFFILASLSTKSSFGQLEPISNDYPNVTDDRGTKPFNADFKIRLTMPGVMGLGLSGTFVKPNIIHVYGESGIGWTFKTKKEDTERSWVSPWGILKVGYPLHFSSSGSGKFYTSISTSGNTTTANYYKVNAPVHHYIIPEVGIHLNPVAYRIITQPGYTGADGVAPVDKHFYSFQATVLTAGVNYKNIIKCDVRVKDSGNGGIKTGEVTRYAGIKAGVLFALKDQITPTKGGKVIDKSDGLGYYVTLTIPYHADSFEFGINSLGYNDKDNREKAAQIYFGWTTYF